MRTTWTFHGPGRLVFGRDCTRQLPEIVAEIGGGRVLIVTDRQLAVTAAAGRVRDVLDSANVDTEWFDESRPDPPVNIVHRCAEVARDVKPAVLIGLGGGSNMDMAKAAATLIAHGGTCHDYAGDQLVPGPIHPLVLMPTTSGTGSEVTAAAVLNDTEHERKFAILSNHLRPRVALVDPLLSATCPAKVTADSGIDALSHAVEAYTAIDNELFPLPAGESSVYQGRHPLADVVAEKAIGLIGRYLRRAVSDGNDVEAREGMSLAATTAGMAFSNVGVAVVHALEYALAPVSHTTHGCGCGLLLPYVMRFNRPARVARMAAIAALLGEDVSGLGENAAADRAAEAVERLKADIGIPATLGDVGVQPDDLPAMAEIAIGIRRILRVNPRAVTREDLQGILSSAL